MTIKKFIENSNFKPLTEKEIKNKQKVKIRGTEELMPWTEVYTRLSAGMSIEHVVFIYGNARKIALFAQLDGIEINETLSETLDQEILQRRKMNEIEASNPVVARTMKEMVNEYAPDVGRDVVMLSQQMVKKAKTLVEEDECTSSDLKNIATAIQTMTDTIEITQRHGASVQLNAGNISVEGFSFVLDSPPDPVEVDAIDVVDADNG